MSTDPEFMVLGYVTLTKDPHTELVVAVGGTERAADILQQHDFLPASGPRGDHHRLPRCAPEQQRLKATAASYTLLTAGYNVYLDPTLNTLATPDGDREATVRHLGQLAEQALHAKTGTQIAEVLTEIADGAQGLPLTREVVLTAWNNPASYRSAATGTEGGPCAQLAEAATALSVLMGILRHARDQTAHSPEQPAPAPTAAQPPQSPDTPPRRRR
ncbi:hypothetical protein GCM10010400_46630 [Streptomyces aculeolatus]|uniref:hypothetical protein n=1 Tax=Streptomyces aculeolatus TaxID=270689 RepID=UPI001CECEBF1|nr:hypothetical protein [Streptomyces aculeolatus]